MSIATGSLPLHPAGREMAAGSRRRLDGAAARPTLCAPQAPPVIDSVPLTLAALGLQRDPGAISALVARMRLGLS